MRVRVAGAHQFAAVFEDLHVADPGDLRKRSVLLDPSVNDAPQFLSVHSRNGEIVARSETQYSADAAVGLGDEQTILLVLQRLDFGQKRGKIVVEGVSSGILRSLLAAGSLVSRAEITIGIVSNRRWRWKLFHFSLPRALGPLRRDEHPLAQERIEAFVGSAKQFFKIHDNYSKP